MWGTRTPCGSNSESWEEPPTPEMSLSSLGAAGLCREAGDFSMLPLAHRALEGINLAGVGLDLVPVLQHLLFGLPQCIVVFVGRLRQVRHLGTEHLGSVGMAPRWSPLRWGQPEPAASHTLDLYHSSASAMFLAAMLSY